MHPDFDAVRALDLDAQRALLSRGDAPERLWAAWSIAMRHPAPAHLGAAAGEEPSEGVRAGLCTILAGFGHIEPLLVMADADPAPLVRGNACRLLCRLARVNDDRLQTLLRDRLVDDASTDVRVIVIDELPADAPSSTWSAVRLALADASEDVRRAAIDRLGARLGLDAEAERAMFGRVVREPSNALRERILTALLAHAGGAMLSALIDMPADVVATALRVAGERSVRLSSDTLFSMLARREPAITLELLALDAAELIRIDNHRLLELALAAWSGVTWWSVGAPALNRAVERMRAAGAVSREEALGARALVVLIDSGMEEARAEARAYDPTAEGQLLDELVEEEWLPLPRSLLDELRRYASF